jgi:hypothetical protein
MSGPIVRRYGFPNFDKIFGERPLQHGVEEHEQPEAPAGESSSGKSKPKSRSSAKVPKAKKGKGVQ